MSLQPAGRRRPIAILAGGIALVAAVVVLVGVRPDTAYADWAADCTSPTVTYTATNPAPPNLNLTAADRVLFASGTYSGSINSNGATICVDTPAVFQPTNVNGASRLFVRGLARMPALAVGDGALLDNEGTVEFLAQVNTNGITEVINRVGATITVAAPGLALGPGVTVTNDGTITVNGFVNTNGSGTTITNNEQITITGTFTMNGTVTNTDRLVVGEQLTINGDGQVVNSCSITANGMINDNIVRNSGIIDVRPGGLNNPGGSTYTQTSTAISLGADFTNDGTVNGTGQYLFSGNTRTQGTFAGTDPADPIVFYDTTSTGSIFDVQSGTVTNTVRAVVTPPPAGSCNVLPPTPTTTTTVQPTTTTAPPTTTTVPATTTTLAATTTTSTVPASSTTSTVPTSSTTTTTVASGTTTTTTPPAATTTTTATGGSGGSGGSGGGLPATGSDAASGALMGALCVALGLVLLLARRSAG